MKTVPGYCLYRDSDRAMSYGQDHVVIFHARIIVLEAV